MKSNCFLQLIIVCFFSLCATCVQAESISEVEAKIWVEKNGNTLLETFSEKDIYTKYKKLDNLFINHVDLDYIAKFVMGRHWRTMSEEQQQRYVPLFKRYSLSVYKGFPLSFENKIDFEVTKVSNDGNSTSVMTLINLEAQGDKKANVTAEFRLNKKDNQIKIIDIKLGESSLILSYRNRFNEMIMQSDSDIEWFLEDLEMITASTEQNVNQKLEASQE